MVGLGYFLINNGLDNKDKKDKRLSNILELVNRYSTPYVNIFDLSGTNLCVLDRSDCMVFAGGLNNFIYRYDHTTEA